jgi:hypothetical protein
MAVREFPKNISSIYLYQGLAYRLFQGQGPNPERLHSFLQAG